MVCPTQCEFCSWKDPYKEIKTTADIVCRWCNTNFALKSGDPSTNTDPSCIAVIDCSGEASPSYFNPDSNACAVCDNNCLNCVWIDYFLQNVCLWCDTTYKNDYGYCVLQEAGETAKCPPYFFEDSANKMCEPCPFGCQICKKLTSGDLSCTKCMEGFDSIASEGRCAFKKTSDCPNNAYEKDGGCVQCAVGCSHCNLEKATGKPRCFKCDNEFEWGLNSQGVCLKRQCEETYSFDQEKGCSRCPNFVKRCKFSSTGAIVVECIDEYTQSGNTCVFNPSSCTGATSASDG